VRVALIGWTLDHGGAERHILKLSRSLASSSIEPVVVALCRDARHDLRPQFERAGVPVVIPPYARNDSRVLRWFAGFLRSERIDVGHSFLWRPDATFALVAGLSGFRNVICSERGDRLWSVYWHRRWWWRRAFDRTVTFRRARRLVSNSHAGAEALIKAGCPPAKTLVIPNGVNLSDVESARAEGLEIRERYNWAGRFVIGFVGRLEPLKGTQDFVMTAADIVKTSPCAPVTFVMVGDGPLRQRLEALVADAGLTDRIVFTGRVDSSLALMHAMDAGVLCSPEGSAESCPNALLEFMACGKPVIATPVAGIPELVDDGRTGRLVPPGSTRAMAEACMAMVRSPELADSWGRAGRDSVTRNFQMSSVASRFIDLYSRVASES